MFPVHRRLSKPVRAVGVALLMLALIWQPALLAASEVHETAHLLQMGHAHDADDEGPGIPEDEPTAHDDGAFWHGLMHLGHCCGHVSALPSDGVPAHPALMPACVPVSPALVIQSLTLPHPLRPPIRA